MPKRKRTPTYGPRKRRRVFKKRVAPYRIRQRRFTKAVKKLIQSTAETKRTSADPVSYTFNANNGAMSAPIDLPSQFISLAQGTGDGERVGEQVNTKKATLKMLIQSNATEASVLQVFIGYRKNSPGILPSAPNLTDVFDDGAGTAPADGSLLSLMRSTNTDEWRFFTYRKLKVGPSNATGMVNNDFPAYRKIYIDLTKHLGKLRYQDNTSQPPTNKHMYLFMNWVNPATGTSSTNPPKVQFYLDYTYTDM